MRSLASVALMLTLGAFTVACGGGTTDTPIVGVPAASVDAINGPFNAFIAEPFELTGSGFGPVGDDVTVRFTSVNGAVFQDGTEEWAEVQATIVSSTLITGVTPLAIASGIFEAFVGVDRAGQDPLLSFVPIARFVALQVDGADTTTVDSDIPAEILVSGDGFAPVGGTLFVEFVAAADDFSDGAGGKTDRLRRSADVLSATELRLLTPVAGASALTAARIQVIRADGFQGSTLDPAISFVPPAVTGVDSLSIEAENPMALVLEGSGLAPDLGSVTLRFTAATPVFGGDTVAESAGEIRSSTLIHAESPAVLGLLEKVEAELEIVLPSGAIVPFSGGTFTFEPDPNAADDAFDVIGNVALVIEVDDPSAEGLLANDSDPDAGDTLSVTGIDTTGTLGDVSFEADGGFTYDPAPGHTGTDSFDYIVSDGVAFATATVTLSVYGRRWFIEESSPAGGDGRLSSPFKTLAEFNSAQSKAAPAAPAADDLVFVFEGDSASYEGGLTLLDGMTLVGESEGLTVKSPPTTGTDVEVVAPGDSPNIGHGTGGVAITLGTDNTIRGVNIDNQYGAGLKGEDVGTLVVRDMEINVLGGEALDVDGGTLDLELSSIFCASTEAATPVQPGRGILLNDVQGTIDIVLVTQDDDDGEPVTLKSGVVQIRETVDEGVKITDTSGDLDITIQELDISEPGDTALLIDAVDGSLTVDGRLRLVTPAAGDALVHIEGSDLDVRFDTVSITGALFTENMAGDTELQFVGGHGIELVEHTGSFEVLGGSMGQFGDCAIYAIDCSGDITLDGTIDHDGVKGRDGLVVHTTGIAAASAASPRPAHGLGLFECTGTITVEGCTFRVMQERLPPVGGPAPADSFEQNNAIHLQNTSGTLTALIVEGNRLSGSRGDPNPPAPETPKDHLPASGDFGVRVVLDGSAIATKIEILDNEAVDFEAGAFGIVLDPDENGTTAGLPRLADLAITGNGRGKKLAADGVTEVDRDPLANHLAEVVIDVRGKSQVSTFSVSKNTMVGDNDRSPGIPFARGRGIVLNLGEIGGAGSPEADVTGTISENVLLDLGAAAADAGIAVTATGASALVLLIDDNQVDGQSGPAIDILIQDDTEADVTCTSNELGLIEENDEVDAAAAVTPLVAFAVRCEDDSVLCLKVAANQTVNDIQIVAAGASALSFEGITGTPAPTAPYTDAEVETSLAASNNTASGASGAIVVTAADAAGSCTVAQP